MTVSCTLGPQLKEEALSIDMKLLLNTEILKRVRVTGLIHLVFRTFSCDILKLQ